MISDEQIESKALEYFAPGGEQDLGFEKGAKWMRSEMTLKVLAEMERYCKEFTLTPQNTASTKGCSHMATQLWQHMKSLLTDPQI